MSQERCERCGCFHGPARCFADDPVGWPIVQRTLRMMRGCWGRNRAMWPREQVKAEAAEIRAAPSMVRLGTAIPAGRSAAEVITVLAQRTAEADRRRHRGSRASA